MGPDALMQVLHQLPHVKDKDLLVGIETADDAGVYRISDELAIISTLDFFPPLVDDPFTFGAIAAANSLSDVYAMGGTPRLAMNIVCFPKDLSLDILNEIIRGSMEKLKEADTLLVGGHSIEDTEIKYGLSVTGFVNPGNIKTNRRAAAGDILILTKPVGTGIIASALKGGRLKQVDAAQALAGMTYLNKAASMAMVEAGANACTDIKGFGVLGHAMEMAKGSDVNLVIRASDILLYPLAYELVRKKANRPRTLLTNRDFLIKDINITIRDNDLELLLFDPQTSGGLLISIPGERASVLIEKLGERGVNGVVIGKVVRKEEGWRIRVE